MNFNCSSSECAWHFTCFLPYKLEHATVSTAKDATMFVLPESIWTYQNTELIRDVISNAESIAIAGHINPDGDSIGSLLSLGAGLELLGKKVYRICDDPIPSKYLMLPGISRIVKWCPQNVDLAIAVDCGSLEMLGSAVNVFQYANAILEIDHHYCRVPFGDYSLVDPHASSAGELVYTLMCDLDIPITVEIASNILTSIIVETNSFRMPDVNHRTFEVCAELLKTGIDFNQLTEIMCWHISKSTALLSGIALSRCKFSRNGALAWSTLTHRDFTKTGSSDADADPIPEKIRSIQGVKIGILFREARLKKWRVSFRSKDGINVAHIAEMFGGGGHLNAAGCSQCVDKKAIKRIIACANTMLDSRNSGDSTCTIFPKNADISPHDNTDSILHSDILFLESIPIYEKRTKKVSGCPVK